MENERTREIRSDIGHAVQPLLHNLSVMPYHAI